MVSGPVSYTHLDVYKRQGLTPFARDIVMPMDRQKGDQLPVSVFQKCGVLDGTWENGTSVFSKRGVATKVPKCCLLYTSRCV